MILKQVGRRKTISVPLKKGVTFFGDRQMQTVRHIDFYFSSAHAFVLSSQIDNARAQNRGAVTFTKRTKGCFGESNRAIWNNAFLKVGKTLKNQVPYKLRYTACDLQFGYSGYSKLAVLLNRSLKPLWAGINPCALILKIMTQWFVYRHFHIPRKLRENSLRIRSVILCPLIWFVCKDTHVIDHATCLDFTLTTG